MGKWAKRPSTCEYHQDMSWEYTIGGKKKYMSARFYQYHILSIHAQTKIQTFMDVAMLSYLIK